MTKNVQVTVEGMDGRISTDGRISRDGRISTDGGLSGDKVVSSVPGIYHYKNGRHYIQYTDETEDGVRTNNYIKHFKDTISVKKQGAYSSDLLFNPYESTTGNYNTPYGNFLFIIHTSELSVKASEDRLEINLRYTLSDSNGLLSDNRVIITVVSYDGE